MAIALLAPMRPALADVGYDAQVTAANTFALSGPGAGYYPTALLTPGEVVTVLGPKRGDWLAIHPPKGSFSWIPADKVEERPDGTAVVRDAEVRVRVGSQLSDAHHVFQVTLRKGDVVQILDHAHLRDQGAIGEWFKITPPKDEVRYVAAVQLRAIGAEESGSARVDAEATTEPPDFRPVGNRVIPPAQPLRTVTSSEYNERAERLLPAIDPSEQYRDDPSRPLDARIRSTRGYLERMRTRDPATWDLPAVRESLERMLDRAKTSEERTELLELLDSTRQLTELEDRFRRVSRRRELALRRDQELAELQRRKLNDVQSVAPRFPAEGILDRAILSIEGQPSFAIKDARGLVTHYVVAAPGLNLARYVGRRVGLLGETSSRPGVPVPVLTATQLVPRDAASSPPPQGVDDR